MNAPLYFRPLNCISMWSNRAYQERLKQSVCSATPNQITSLFSLNTFTKKTKPLISCNLTLRTATSLLYFLCRYLTWLVYICLSETQDVYKQKVIVWYIWKGTSQNEVYVEGNYFTICFYGLVFFFGQDQHLEERDVYLWRPPVHDHL